MMSLSCSESPNLQAWATNMHAWSLQSAIDSTHAMSKPFASSVFETLQMEQESV